MQNTCNSVLCALFVADLMNKLLLTTFLLSLIFGASHATAELRVATLHPLMTDLARQVGGSDVTVVPLLGKNDNPHTFSPSPKALAKARGATVYLVSGKNLENYLSSLRSTLGSSAKLVEVGKSVPSQKISSRDAHYVCCPTHAHGAIDPHWWHKVSNMQKAARVVAKEFGKADPSKASAYKARATAYSARLSQLDSWIKRETSRIPKQDRILCTAHAAFGYFCKTYGYRSLPVQGISSNQTISATYQAEAIKAIRDHNVKAIFPEKRANPKALKVLTKETGVRFGGTLIADGADNYETMMKTNVNYIVKGLTGR